MNRTVLVLGLAALIGGCGGDDSGTAACTEPEILPHQSPVHLPDTRLLVAGETPDAGNRFATPYEWVLLLQSNCTTPVEINEVCIVGDDHNGQPGNKAFTIEGPAPASVPYGTEAAVRVTYDPDTENTLDADGDGNPDPDRVAIVIQSNAVNFPTLIVPLCARALAPDVTAPGYHCNSPVTLVAGAVDKSLCP